MTKKVKKKRSFRSFVAKNVQHSGAGMHQLKQGPRASRARQKANQRKDMHDGK